MFYRDNVNSGTSLNKQHARKQVEEFKKAHVFVSGIVVTVDGLTIFCAAKISLRCYNLCWGLGKNEKTYVCNTALLLLGMKKTYDRFLVFIHHVLKCCLDDDTYTCLVNMMITGGLRKVPVFRKNRYIVWIWSWWGMLPGDHFTGTD